MALRRSELITLVSLAALAFIVLLAGAGFIFSTRYKSGRSAMLTPLQFGLSNRVQIENDPELEFGTRAFTISFWFRTTSKQRYLTMISKRNDPMGDGWIIHGQENNTF